MDIPRWGQAQAAGELRAEVAQDVAKEIAGHDDAKLPGIADHFHDQGVDVEVARLDVRIFILYLRKYALPEFVAEGEGIRFVAHADAAEVVLAGVLEGVADDALDAFTRVDILLHCDFVRGAALELSSHSYVEAFGVLADNYEVHIIG